MYETLCQFIQYMSVYQQCMQDQLISGVNFQDQSVNHRHPHLTN